ncbi:MAG: response regulator transcription factor [Candidatus Gracilibacteria bacterium]|nr:response regulator transcription factor [Candidatus Gracilibacteria bacterium]
MKKILIIEDDKGISASLKLYLENSDFLVELHNEGLEAISKIKNVKPDLIILDINLPGKDGIEITKELRGFSSIPIIMLTARSSELDRVNGLEIGADDYIAKPFSPRELLARINTIIRRMTVTSTPVVSTGKDVFSLYGVELNVNKKIVKVDSNPIVLTSNEYEILRKLIQEKGKIVTRETIMKDIIGYDKYIYDRTIDTHIKNLRKKVGKIDFILTIRGEGYRINI